MIVVLSVVKHLEFSRAAENLRFKDRLEIWNFW